MSPRAPERILRVGQLNRFVRVKLERWGEVWVEGELSDVTRAPSGHLYFCLNDSVEPAQVRAVMFRGDARSAKAAMREGERVRVRGTFTFYEPRGAFQLRCRLALPAGEGDRREQLERLKKKLAAEGLFRVERKRRLPRFPSVVGLVTSRRGAALHDVVRVASGRAPVRLVISQCLVQGPDAPTSIIAALRRVCGVPGLEVIILTRGGGASEDLAAFDDEAVARAIAACPVPVVAGVGHEVDETIADLVADVRAATPSNAAEIVVPDRSALSAEIAGHRRHLEQGLAMQLGRERLRLERLERRLSDPRRALGGVRHRFGASRAALDRSIARAVVRQRQRLAKLEQRLRRLDPRVSLAQDRARFKALVHRLEQSAGPSLLARRRELFDRDAALRVAIRPALTSRMATLGQTAARLEALSPLSVLSRGYAIALHEPTGRALLRADDAQPGDRVRLRLSEGTLLAEVVAEAPAEGREPTP